MSWEEVVDFPKYEIWTEFPYQIRKKSTQRIVKEYVESKGYLRCYLGNKYVKKHTIIAKQFIPNPNNYPCIDHVNNIRTDNRIDNLRWVSYQMNNNNRYYQTLVDEISDDCILVEKYNDWEFEFLYFDPETDTFYYYNGLKYVAKPKLMKKNRRSWSIQLYDKNGIRREIQYNKFKKQYGLI